MKVLFLYNKPRMALYDAHLKNQAPDELLYCFESVKQFGVEPYFSDDGFVPGFATPVYRLIERVLSRKGERVGFNLNQALRLRREFEKYDLVFATADSNALPVLFLKYMGWIDVPVVYGSIGLAEAFRGAENSKIPRFYKKLLFHADRIIYYGYGEGAILNQLYEQPKEKLRFISLGTDTRFFEPVKDLPSEDWILSLGVDRRRDWRTFLRATKGLDMRFKLITDPLLLRGMTWPSNVEVLPLQDITKIREMMARARFIVLPVKKNCYTAATFTLLQSMAAGKAVIVSKTEAIDGGYQFDFGQELLAVAPEDMVALRLAIKALDSDPARVAAIGKKAAISIKEKYSIKDYARRIVNIFEEVLG